LAINLLIGFALLFGVVHSSKEDSVMWFFGYSVIAPLLHIAYLRCLYSWSLAQGRDFKQSRP